MELEFDESTDRDFEGSSETNSDGSSANVFYEPPVHRSLDALHRLNNTVNNLISIMLTDVQSVNNETASRKSTEIGFDYALFNLFQRYRLTDTNARDFVIKVYIRNLIFCAVHSWFFEGQHFYGVLSDSHHASLEVMMTKLLSNGRSSISQTD
jgi:hypothetical protein